MRLLFKDNAIDVEIEGKENVSYDLLNFDSHKLIEILEICAESDKEDVIIECTDDVTPIAKRMAEIFESTIKNAR